MSGNPPHPWGDYSHCRNFSSYVQSESPQELLVHISPHIFHMTPCKKGVWSLLPFFQYQRVKMSPLCLLFSKLNKPTSLSLSPHARLSPSLLIFVASLWTLSSQSIPFLYSREQTWTQYSRPGKCWVNWDSKFLISAGDALVDAAQPPAGFLCPSCILVTHTELLVHQDPKIPFHKAASQAGRSKPLLKFWIMFSQMQYLTLVLVELYRILSSPLLQTI